MSTSSKDPHQLTTSTSHVAPLSIQAAELSPNGVPTSGISVQFDLADLLLSYLSKLNVEYVFGIPGGAIEPLYNALARSERISGPKAIVARHETGAVFMADGYARRTGKLGVCCATSALAS